MRSHALMAHTADARAAIRGDTLPELFRAALEALAELETGEAPATAADLPLRRRVRLAAADTSVLLVDFLSEVLTLSLVETAVFEDLHVHELSEKTADVEVLGRPVPAFLHDVKAVTYHEADVRPDGEGHWHTHLVFDV